jgi:hypothetical protein
MPLNNNNDGDARRARLRGFRGPGTGVVPRFLEACSLLRATCFTTHRFTPCRAALSLCGPCALGLALRVARPRVCVEASVHEPRRTLHATHVVCTNTHTHTGQRPWRRAWLIRPLHNFTTTSSVLAASVRPAYALAAAGSEPASSSSSCSSFMMSSPPTSVPSPYS